MAAEQMSVCFVSMHGALNAVDPRLAQPYEIVHDPLAHAELAAWNLPELRMCAYSEYHIGLSRCAAPTPGWACCMLAARIL